MGKRLHTIEDVKEYVESFNYKLLSTEYSYYTKLELKCPEGHIFEMRYNAFQQGQRCPICAGVEKHTLEEVKEYIESFDYKLLSTEYKHSKSKLELQCSEGHIFKMRYNAFQQGQRCPECMGKKRYSIDNIKEYVEKFDYKVLSDEYINNSTKLELKCPEGHIFEMRFNNFHTGQRCPECSNSKGWSKPEKEIAEYVKTIYFNEVIENDRTQIMNYKTGKNLELDIWIPELSKAIEYNGLHWHNNDKVKYRDNIKIKQCIEKGIDLLVIEDKDWYSDKVCCLSNITKFIM